MNLPAGINKWGVAALGVVCLFLVVKLVAQYRGMQPGKSRPHPATVSTSPVRAGKASSHVVDDLAQYDPDVDYAALKAMDSRPIPDEKRIPFEFSGGAAPPVAKADAPAPGLPPSPPPPLPPPPPPPLKAVGYNKLPGGKKEAMVTFNDDLVVVHEGDIVGMRFEVVKINPTMVTVEDAETHQTFELPFPQ